MNSKVEIKLAAYYLLAFFLVFCPGGIAREISFNRDIRPILSDRCFACHGPDASDRKAKLRLDRADGPEGAFRINDGTAAIVPGSLAESILWERITTEDTDEIMPPVKAHKKPLSSEEQDLVRMWIEGGAQYEAFWSFVPAKMPEVPKVRRADWSNHQIDLHILKQIEDAGLSPAQEANKRTLIRRVSFDLTGLPPSRQDVRNFVADESPEAYEQLVERLLASERYGEHMARYWMDLVRFADTNGMHKDFFRNHAPYRDWVIRSFNENLGYDDFVRYQLAGDLFPEASNDQMVASGFNRLHLIIDRGTALPEESFFKNVVDRVTAVGTAFMGMTVHCASCHDHKYDPFTQKDFYSLFAFFNNIDAAAETAGAPKNGLQPPFMMLGTAQQMDRVKEIDSQLAEMSPKAEAAKKRATEEADPEKKTNSTQVARELVSRLQELKRERERIDREMPRAMVMKERQEVRITHILKRGQYDDPGAVVQRDAPGFLHPLNKGGEVASRMDLAEWFVAPENPLTARVAVNRFWQQLFGVGLVRTSEDLGAQGEMPSHPQLLDFLTVSFIESGWDIKELIRQIVMSKAYRQTSVASAEQFRKDPENRLLARGSRFRMDAEMIRDQILFTSGMLVNKMYGRSVKPPQPDGLWKAVTMIGERFRPDSGDAIHRRSLYTYWKRGMPPPQMTILNAPIRDACTARRERTNTPSQALLLLNESEYLKAARQLALTALGPREATAVQRLAFIYETVTSQLPDPSEQKVLAKLLDNLHEKYTSHPELADQICSGVNIENVDQKAQLAAWTVLVNTLYNLDITKTRE